MQIRYLAAFALAAASLASAGAEVGKEWESVDPAVCGYDAAKIRALGDFIRERKMGTTGLMVVVGGRVMFSYGDLAEVSYIASCRKSVLSMLYGKYVEQGVIKLDETVGEIGIDDVGGLLPSEKEVTVRDLITSRSGCYHPASNPGGIKAGHEPPRGKTPHGTKFLYNNWDFNVAGTVFEKKAGISVFKAFDRDFAPVLQLQDWDLAQQKLGGDPKKSIHLAYYFSFSTRDMARIGELMLRKGRWHGKQLVPEKWVEESTKPFTKMPSGGYGYMWWAMEDKTYPDAFKGAFSARGLYGQFITVLPELDMVIAHKSARNKKHPTRRGDYFELLRRIVAASAVPEKIPAVVFEDVLDPDASHVQGACSSGDAVYLTQKTWLYKFGRDGKFADITAR